MVKVYSFEGCPWCDKVKKYLKSKNIEFETRDVVMDDTARDECEQISGDTAVAVTTIDGKNFVLGFDKAKLDELLAS